MSLRDHPLIIAFQAFPWQSVFLLLSVVISSGTLLIRGFLLFFGPRFELQGKRIPLLDAVERLTGRIAVLYVGLWLPWEMYQWIIARAQGCIYDPASSILKEYSDVDLTAFGMLIVLAITSYALCLISRELARFINRRSGPPFTQ
jgi:hypothetical protein